VLDPKVFPDDAKEGYCHTFVGPEKRRRKGAVVRVLEQAAEEAVRTASPAQQRKIAAQLDVVVKGPELVEQASRMARVRSGESDFAQTVMMPEGLELGLALGRAVVGDLAKQDCISREDPGFLEKALERVAPSLRRALGESRRDQKLTAKAIAWAIHAALGVVLDRSALAVSPLLPGGVRPDVLIGAPGEPAAQTAVIEVRLVNAPLDRALKHGFWNLDAALTASGAAHGALVLFNPGSISENDPVLEHITTPAGRDVLLLAL